MINLIKKKGVNPQTKEVIYFPQWTRKETIDGQKLATIMARGGSFSLGECTGVLLDFPQYFIDSLLDGNAVSIMGLGTFKLRVNGKSKAKMEDVTSQGATLGVLFEPDTKLMTRLNSEKQFQFVEKPTAEGEQDATEDVIADNTQPSAPSTEDNTPAEPQDNTQSGGNTEGGVGGDE